MKTKTMKVIESGEPVLVLVVSPQGLERTLILYDESVEALEQGNLLLARLAPQLLLLDNAARGETPVVGAETV